MDQSNWLMKTSGWPSKKEENLIMLPSECLESFSTLEKVVEESCRLKYNDNECVKSASFSFSCRTTDGMIVVSGDNDLN